MLTDIALRARLLIAALWVGSLWTIGCIAAPILFASLPDKVLAGTIAGKMFRVEAWLSVGCALTLMALIVLTSKGGTATLRRPQQTLIVAMLVCTVLGYFGLQPFMAALRESAGSAVMASPVKTQFAVLHGIASIAYLIESVLGIVLIVKLR